MVAATPIPRIVVSPQRLHQCPGDRGSQRQPRLPPAQAYRQVPQKRRVRIQRVDPSHEVSHSGQDTIGYRQRHGLDPTATHLAVVVHARTASSRPATTHNHASYGFRCLSQDGQTAHAEGGRAHIRIDLKTLRPAVWADDTRSEMKALCRYGDRVFQLIAHHHEVEDEVLWPMLRSGSSRTGDTAGLRHGSQPWSIRVLRSLPSKIKVSREPDFVRECVR